MKIEILSGRDAERLISDPGFCEKWKQLYNSCPWSSVFQSEDFVLTWYPTYQSQFTPLVVTGFDEDNKLAGLFTLAIEQESGKLVVAGSIEAEYQAWLADPRDGNVFIESALQALARKFPKRGLTLLFVLPNTPVDWIQADGQWGRLVNLRTLPRGLMEVGDGISFKDTLRKKKQNKINRMKRLGNLHFDHLRTPEELAALFDEFTSCQNLRLKAIYNLADLPADPLRKAFYVNMMRRPRLLYVTALRLDDRMVSAQLHLYNNEQVLLGRITHSPVYAKYSPGELHMLMVGAELGQQGVPVFDLTPGGDYKERYATHHDEVFVMTIFFNRAGFLKNKIKRRLAETAKSWVQVFNITPGQSRNAYLSFVDWKNKWMRLGLFGLVAHSVSRARRKLSSFEEWRVYAFDLDQPRQAQSEVPLKRDHLADLLAYQPVENWQPPVNTFLRNALEKLEAGRHVYTCVENGKLLFYGWLVDRPEHPDPGEVESELSLPLDAALLTDLYLHAQASERRIGQAAIEQMVTDAAKIAGSKQAYLCISTGNNSLRQAAEAAGLKHQYSYYQKNLIGKKTAWSDGPKVETQSQVQNSQVISRVIGETGE